MRMQSRPSTYSPGTCKTMLQHDTTLTSAANLHEGTSTSRIETSLTTESTVTWYYI